MKEIIPSPVSTYMTNQSYNFANRNIETARIARGSAFSQLADYLMKRHDTPLRRSRRLISDRSKYHFEQSS